MNEHDELLLEHGTAAYMSTLHVYDVDMCSSLAMQVPHTNDYYIKCMFGGVLSCGLTHTLVVPLDVVKCNMQARPPYTQC